ncbi:DUF6499 domain-containing protein [Novosphingobium sp. 1529]|uniref:transcriptional regulator domain-containing protein n=1 Tax=Novosphingobium sp. 1529 TaxID=3156424 RepID=UPI003390E460
MIGGAWAQRVAALSRRGRAGLAWEVLRRDPAYRAAWASASAPASAPIDESVRPVVLSKLATACRWGLHFCRGSGGGLHPRHAGMVYRRGPVRPARPDRVRDGKHVVPFRRPGAPGASHCRHRGRAYRL